MKQLPLFLLTVLPLLVSAKTLTVPADGELVIDANQAMMELERLELGDRATIRFSPEVRIWRLSAKEAVIGQGVVIDGRGKAGAQGREGDSATGQAKDCKDGQPGLAGSPGEKGGDAVQVRLDLGIVSLGGLKVLAVGGQGGPGGPGGDGQTGGDIDHCRGGAGGTGGAGGNGGSGGDGGDVQIRYWPQGELSADQIRERIEVVNTAGAGGGAGKGGAGGPGVKGRYQKGGFAGSKKWLAGGKPGEPGVDGLTGQVGEDGDLRLVENLKKAFGKMMLQSEKTSVNQEAGTNMAAVLQKMQQLQSRIEVLEKRLSTLEAQNNKSGG